MCLKSLSSCFCASLLYLVCPLKKPQSFALLSLQLLSSTSTLALYTTDCTGTFGPLSDWPQIALGPLHAVFNNTTLCCCLILIASRGVRDQHFGPWQFSSKYLRNTLPRWFAVICYVRSGSADGSQPDYTSTDEGIPKFGSHTPNGGDEPTLVSSATGAAGVLAGWAISSIGKKAHNLAFVLCHPSYLPYQFAPTDMEAVIPPAETLLLPCRARQNLQPAADRHCPYPMATNLKACSWVATRPVRIPGGLLAVEGWGLIDVNADADDRSMCSSLLPKVPLINYSIHMRSQILESTSSPQAATLLGGLRRR